MTTMTNKSSRDFLDDYQMDAVEKMKNGCILCGGTGSGKSRTALYYYYKRQGGKISKFEDCIIPEHFKDLYIITTARKRDTLDWEGEMTWFGLSPKTHNIHIDSWNNIKKYKKVSGAFFIFDEQRVVGSGVWVKSFLSIARRNEWILLSATPGDTWSDYIPVFIANGFYKTKQEFLDEHAIFNRWSKYPKIDRYIHIGKLNKFRRQILVEMDYKPHTTQHHEDVMAEYDKLIYNRVYRQRFNPYTNMPIKNASEFCQVLRKIVNTDESRQRAVLELLEDKPKAIIFYNYNYERDILKSLAYEHGTEIAEWNGFAHMPIPKTDRWVYLVQYTAGAEGWNCIETDVTIFYSQNYSYKVMKQSAGRIDRFNTPFDDLYYYHLKSRATIDVAIAMSVNRKRKFNESKFGGFAPETHSITEQ